MGEERETPRSCPPPGVRILSVLTRIRTDRVTGGTAEDGEDVPTTSASARRTDRLGLWDEMVETPWQFVFSRPDGQPSHAGLP